MGGQRAIVQLTREDVGGCKLRGDALAVMASGDIENAHGSTIKCLQARGLVTAEETMSEKGLLVRKKLKGLPT